MIKKIICIIMAIILTTGVCGCQGGAEDAAGASTAGKTAAAGAASGIAADAAISVYDEKEIGGNSGVKFPGGARIDSKNRLLEYDRGAGKFIALDGDGKPVGEIQCVLPGYVAAFDLDPQDGIYAVVAESASENETSQKICVIDSTGKVTDTFELGKYKNGGVPGSMPIVLDMALGADGRIYLAALNGIMIVDNTGKVVKKLGNQAYYSIDTDAEGNIIAASMDNGKQMLEKLDSSSGKSIWSSDIEKDSGGRTISFTTGSLKVRYDSANKSICVMDQNGVYNYDGAGKFTGTVLDFKQYMLLASGNTVSDLNVDLMGNIYVTTGRDENYEIYRYDIEAGTHKAKERKAITLAMPIMDRRLEVAAMKFQKAYPEYRIDIKAYEQDYDPGNGYENYVKTLNTELLTGKGPDIINTSFLPYEKYIDKNMLADLSALMEQDKDFDSGKYYSNIFDALKYKDRLYTLPASIHFDVLAANKKILEQEAVNIEDTLWTWNDFREAGQKLTGKGGSGNSSRKVFISISSRTLLDFMLKGNYSSFVNEQEKKASFDSKDFTDLLALVKELGDSKIPNDMSVANANYDDMDSIENGTVVFNPQTISDYTSYAFLKALYKDQVRLLSYPSSGGARGGVFDSDTLFSINNISKNKDAAWEFLKFLLSDEVQSGELDGFAVNRESLGKAAQKAIEITNSGGMSIAIGGKGEKPKIIIPRPLKQEDIDYVNGFIENMGIYNRNNAGVRKIVSEETPAFFSGGKSAEEVAGLIQQKVNIYLGE